MNGAKYKRLSQTFLTILIINQMIFLKEINNLPVTPQQYNQNYQSNFNWFFRKMVFLHSIFALLSFKKEQLLNNPIKNHLKNIKYQDSSEFLSKELGKAYAESLQQDSNQLTGGKLISIIASTFKVNFIMVIFLFSLEVFLRILSSIFIFYLLIYVGQGDYSQSYLYVGLICFVWLLCQIIIMQAFSKATILSVRIKSSLVMLLQSKVSSLTSYSIRATQTGKITNLLSNDLGTLQANLPIFLNCFSFPLCSIGLTLLLVQWFGWAWILGLMTVALSQSYLQGVNMYKDERINKISEVIEGIRYIKLYGWEIAFTKLIERIRNLEISNLIMISFRRSFERTIGNIAGLAGCFVVFMVAHYQGRVISVPMIFASLEAIISFKNFMRRLNMGLEFYYEINLISQKFTNLFNIKCSSLVKSGEDKVLSKGDVLFNHFNGYWKDDFVTPSLSDITLSFKKGLLYGITGKVGSGKSGLLGVILGEIFFYSGNFEAD